MNNEVASPCCGSCKYSYLGFERSLFCHSPHKGEIPIRLDKLCCDDGYKPLNPIPLINVPGVKEIVEAAYRTGGSGAPLGIKFKGDKR